MRFSSLRERIEAKELTQDSAAAMLGMSVRTFQRWAARDEAEGNPAMQREAWQHLREALQTAREIGSISATLFGLVSAAGILARQGAEAWAAEIAALVYHHPAANQETKNRAAQLLAEAEAPLPAPVLAAARERGQTRELAAAAADVLEWAHARLAGPAE